jgi:hypothetical protein
MSTAWIRPGSVRVAEALAEARAERQRRRDAGFDQPALDLAARVGFANGAFEELEEDAASVIDEFYPETGREEERSADAGQAESTRKPLADRLDARLGDARQRAALAKPAPPALPA